jgi:predicted dehydrogenase
MRTPTVRCGVIGAGWWATYAHIPALLEHPSAELVGIQKRSISEARQVASHFGIEKAFDSVEDLLAEGLDAAVVSSTPHLHFSHAKAALESGAHVLIEKPMTVHSCEARELKAIATANGRELLISCPWHYTRHGIAARELIHSGAIGTVRMISVLMTNPVRALISGTSVQPTHGLPGLKPRPGTYSDPSIAGGGQIYTQGSHIAAYLKFLTGMHATEVLARFNNDGCEMDIYDSLLVTLENGALVSIASTGATPESERVYEVRVFGTEAILYLELWRGTMRTVSIRTGQEVNHPRLSPAEIYPERAPALNLVDTTLGARRNGSPGDLGVTAMEIIEAACHSAATGTAVHIPGNAA